jgi:hypothetical protein
MAPLQLPETVIFGNIRTIAPVRQKMKIRTPRQRLRIRSGSRFEQLKNATSCRVTKIYVTAVVCLRSYLKSTAAIQYDDDGLGPKPKQAFHSPAGIYPGGNQLLSRSGMDDRDSATRCSR